MQSDPASPSDAELLPRIARGELDALGVLYDRYANLLFPLTLRILRDRAEAEDILHDAFVLVSERAAQFTPERGTVASWLITLVRNLAIDRARRRERRGMLAQQDAATQRDADDQTPEAIAGDARERDHVRRALATLPEAQRETLVVAFFEGLSYPEIAEREGVPLGTVKSRAARAMTALRDALHATETTTRQPGQGAKA
jgi:RNA polymerase sigma-70 factor (ECF subfamily)